jgi:diguanylate cyclase (GGDEF)-like protein
MLMPHLGIRARAMLLVLIAALPFAFLIQRSADQQREQLRGRLAERAEQLARFVAARHAEILAEAHRVLSAAARLEGNLAGAPDCDRRLKLLVDTTPVQFLSVAAPSGKILCSTRSAAVGLDVGDREYFKAALGTNGFVTSGVTRSRVTERDVVFAAQPVTRATGRPEAVLIAGIDFDWIPRAVSESGALQSFEALIVSGSGEVLHRIASGPRVSAPGESRVSGEARFPLASGAAARVRVELPAELADVAADNALRDGLTVLGAVFALALLVAWVGSALFVVRPLRQLADAATKLDTADLSVRTGIPHYGHEIGQLARHLDILAAHRQKVTRALRALSAGNRTLLREQDEPELLQAMCGVAVEKGGYPLAVVYYAASDEEKSVVPAASAGDDRGALAAMRLTWEDNERGQGTVGTAIRSGRTTVFQSIAQAPGAAPWREHLLPRGFGSVASMPLRVDGDVIGTFTLFAAETDAFDGEELELVQEMADDLAFGVAACRERLKRIDAEREARRVATHDALTDLHNRSYFLNALAQAIAKAAGQGMPLAVLAIHIRDLPALFDGLGYGPGTQVIREIAERLRRVVPEGELLARVPPDDFVVLRAGADAERASALAAELLAAFGTPVALDEARIDVQGHVGASFFPGHGDEPDLLLRRAAIAARDGAKRDQPFTAYAGATEREDPARLALVGDLRRAIEQRSLHLHFQPKVDLGAGRIVGSEALVRWRHPERGSISPGQFVPLAEQTGLIRQMTYLVIETAIRQQRAWLDGGVRLPLAVNLSVRNLYDPRLVERIHGLLATWGVPGEMLEFEITEGALVEEPQTARAVLERLRKAGGKIYIDDFGTGYSSLSYLVSLPVHALKIDRSFIVQMSSSREARSVVASVISMGHQLGLRVVAEGVEREQERDALVALGCDEAQGYLLGRPMEADAFRAKLA